MLGLNEIFKELKGLLSPHFKTVRMTALPVNEQLTNELMAINPDNLPAVLVVYKRGEFTHQNAVRDNIVSLVIIDRYRAGDDERALGAFEVLEKAIGVFIPYGRQTDSGTVYLPLDCGTVSVDPSYACFELSLAVKQPAV